MKRSASTELEGERQARTHRLMARAVSEVLAEQAASGSAARSSQLSREEQKWIRQISLLQNQMTILFERYLGHPVGTVAEDWEYRREEALREREEVGNPRWAEILLLGMEDSQPCLQEWAQELKKLYEGAGLEHPPITEKLKHLTELEINYVVERYYGEEELRTQVTIKDTELARRECPSALFQRNPLGWYDGVVRSYHQLLEWGEGARQRCQPEYHELTMFAESDLGTLGQLANFHRINLELFAHLCETLISRLHTLYLLAGSLSLDSL